MRARAIAWQYHCRLLLRLRWAQLQRSSLSEWQIRLMALLGNNKMIAQPPIPPELWEHPLNVDAVRWLKLAGEEVDPSYLAVFQLLLWGLDQPATPFQEPQLREGLRHAAEVLAFGRSAANALAYLLENPEGDPEEPNIDAHQVQSASEVPQDAANQLAYALHNRLQVDENLEDSYPANPSQQFPVDRAHPND